MAWAKRDESNHEHVDRHLADHRALVDRARRDSENTESTYPKGKATLPGGDQHARLDQQLDKTLSTVAEGLPKGPRKTPGGHGQIFS